LDNNEQNLNEMLKIRREKLTKLMESGKNPYLIEKYNYTHHSDEIKDNYDELEGERVSVAGRLMSRRGHGKVTFFDLQDSNGRIQLFAKKMYLVKKDIKI
jgi:Lysyl-tRNA synthetase (class II)